MSKIHCIVQLFHFMFIVQTTPASTVVYTFYATDADEGTNAVITYELTSPVRE